MEFEVYTTEIVTNQYVYHLEAENEAEAKKRVEENDEIDECDNEDSERTSFRIDEVRVIKPKAEVLKWVMKKLKLSR